MISVLILTKNEEQDLPDCLDSVKWSDDVHVFDSYSSDKTVEIAKNYGAHVTQRKFDNYASQRNVALSQINYKNSWILILDADERIPKQLALQLKDSVQHATEKVDGFRIRRRDFLENVWLKHAQISPFYIRLVRLGKASYHREINEVVQVEGAIEDIDGYFCHFPFSKGYTHWLNKHNQYSTLEAIRWIEEKQNREKFSLQSALFSNDFNKRRYHQKGLFYRLPARPFVKWIYIVFIRRAFLDGLAGITYATLQSIYEYFIILKTRDLLRGNKY